ncbi:MAG: NusA N-terminal domain-containing protein, partial [Flavobacteriales bacterium]
MATVNLIESFAEFKDLKNIDRVTMMGIMEDVFRSVVKKRFGEEAKVDIIINPDKGDLEVWLNRVIVEDGFSEDDNLDIELSEARKIDPDFEEATEGEEVVIEVRADTGSEATALRTRRESGAVQDGVSAEEIRRSPDSDAGQAARRIVGATVVGGQYLFVRGLGGR